MSISSWFVHTATVETFKGKNGYGVDIFAAPVVLAPPNGCFIENARKLVRNKTGDEVVSETTVYTFPANADLFTTDTKVTVTTPTGVVQSRVIKADVNDSGPLGLPDHVAVTLE